MSISLGTWQSQSPSNKKKLARGFLAAAGAFFAVQFLSGPFVDVCAQAWSGVEQRNAQLAALEPFREKAKLWRVDYETAREGDYVEWCVDRPSAGYAYLEGRPSQPLLLSNESVLDVGYPRGHCAMIVGQVEGRKPNGLSVRVIGQP